MPQILPVTSSPNQSLSVPLNINGQTITLDLRVYWNVAISAWMMDIATEFGVPLVYSVPLICGGWPAGNVLGAYGYLQIGSLFVINQSGNASDSPTDTTLGAAGGFSLLWDDNPPS